MGRSSSPEFGLNPNTEPRLYGPCRNPWNLEHSAGGSSGGAAAAVIAGILPVAHATDGGGSIRIPAAQCGLFGLKPSRGRMTLAPDAGEGWGGLSIGHVVSRSVRDSRADARLHRRLRARRSLRGADARVLVRRGARPARPRSSRSPCCSGPPRRQAAPRMHQGGHGRRQAVREPRPHRRGGGCSARSRRAAADEQHASPPPTRRAPSGCAGRRWGASRMPKDVEAVTWAVYQRGLSVSGVAVRRGHRRGPRRRPQARRLSRRLGRAAHHDAARAAAQARLLRPERRRADLRRSRHRVSVRSRPCTTPPARRP